MNPAGNIDAIDLLPLPVVAGADGKDRPFEAGASSAARDSSAGRWWFGFDGWRTAEVEVEFVLA